MYFHTAESVSRLRAFSPDLFMVVSRSSSAHIRWHSPNSSIDSIIYVDQEALVRRSRCGSHVSLSSPLMTQLPEEMRKLTNFMLMCPVWWSDRDCLFAEESNAHRECCLFSLILSLWSISTCTGLPCFRQSNHWETRILYACINCFLSDSFFVAIRWHCMASLESTRQQHPWLDRACQTLPLLFLCLLRVRSDPLFSSGNTILHFKCRTVLGLSGRVPWPDHNTQVEHWTRARETSWWSLMKFARSAAELNVTLLVVTDGWWPLLNWRSIALTHTWAHYAWNLSNGQTKERKRNRNTTGSFLCVLTRLHRLRLTLSIGGDLWNRKKEKRILLISVCERREGKKLILYHRSVYNLVQGHRPSTHVRRTFLLTTSKV